MTTSFPAVSGLSTFVPDSRAAWRRLTIALAIGAVGSIGMWSVVVALPKVQAEFGGTRGAASLAFTLAMLGFGIGGIATGRLADRFGIVPAIGMGIVSLLCGYLAAGASTALWQFTLVHFFIGIGSSATFAPLMAEASHCSYPSRHRVSSASATMSAARSAARRRARRAHMLAYDPYAIASSAP